MTFLKRRVSAAVWELLLASCPPEHREVLRLRRAGMKYHEVAAAVGMHEGSVRRVVREVGRRFAFLRARRGLRLLLILPLLFVVLIIVFVMHGCLSF